MEKSQRIGVSCESVPMICFYFTNTEDSFLQICRSHTIGLLKFFDARVASPPLTFLIQNLGRLLCKDTLRMKSEREEVKMVVLRRKRESWNRRERRRSLLLHHHHWMSSQTMKMTSLRVVEIIHATLKFVAIAIISIQSIVM